MADETKDKPEEKAPHVYWAHDEGGNYSYYLNGQDIGPSLDAVKAEYPDAKIDEQPPCYD